MNLIFNKNKQGKIDFFLSTIKRNRSYCPLRPIPSAVLSTILPLAYNFRLDGYVLLI